MGVPAPQGVSASGKSPLAGDQANGVIQGTLAALGPTAPFAFYGPMNLSIYGEFTTTLTTTNGSLTATVLSAGAIAAGAAIRSANLPYGTTAGVQVTTTLTLVLPPLTYYGKTLSGIAKITDILDTSRLSGATASGLGLAGTETVTVATASVAPNPNLPMGTRGVLTLSAAPTVQPPSDAQTPFVFALTATGAVTTGADAAAVFTGAAIGLTGVVQLERSFDGGQTWLVCNIGSSGALAQWNPATPVTLSFGEPEKMVLYRLNLTAVTPSAGTALKYRISETGQAATTLAVPTI